MGLPYPDSELFPHYHIFLTRMNEIVNIERQRRHYRDIFGDDGEDSESFVADSPEWMNNWGGLAKVEFNPPLDSSKGEGFELTFTIEDNENLKATTKRIYSQPYEYTDALALEDTKSKDMIHLNVAEYMLRKRQWDMRFKSAFPNW